MDKDNIAINVIIAFVCVLIILIYIIACIENNRDTVLRTNNYDLIKDLNGECCSCCPDLAPGEYCIEACCECK